MKYIDVLFPVVPNLFPGFQILQSKEKVKVLLYGEVSLTNNINKQILFLTLNFLKATKQFE